jgi:serine protease Do
MRREAQARLGLLALAAASAWPAAGSAQSDRLWTERRASPVLAQVPDFAALARQVIPAVVSIQVQQRAQRQQALPSVEGPGERRPFFHGNPHELRPNTGIGSGLLVRSEGLILTNNHVVEDAESIEVTLVGQNGAERVLAAKVLGTAPDYDIALVQTLDDARAPIAYLGDSDKMDIGDWVMAVGNPFGLSHSVSVGIISAKERREVTPSGRTGLYDFLQTDASINPGNSGGPLVTMRGEVIGINTAINAQGAGIGFAIPINMVKGMLSDLKTKGSYTRSWIGIKIQPLTAELAQSYGLAQSVGALVSEVVPQSPAQDAGIREGDVLLQFDGKPLRHSSDLPLFASMAGVGKEVRVTLWRDRREQVVGVKLTEFPRDTPTPRSDAAREESRLGLTAADITEELRAEFELGGARGVVLREVEPAGPADRAGVKPGDVALSLNGAPVTTARAFAEAVRATPSGGLLRLQVRRGEGRLYVAIRKP